MEEDAVIVAIETGANLTDTELIDLYDDVGWSAYTRSPSTLRRAIDNSSIIVTARGSSGSLLGLARGLSDDASIFYLQDVLVRPSHHRRGIGQRLLQKCLDRYAHVRQKVLLTDDDEAQRRLYERCGYINTRDFGDAPLNAYVRFETSAT